MSIPNKFLQVLIISPSKGLKSHHSERKNLFLFFKSVVLNSKDVCSTSQLNMPKGEEAMFCQNARLTHPNI